METSRYFAAIKAIATERFLFAMSSPETIRSLPSSRAGTWNGAGPKFLSRIWQTASALKSTPRESIKSKSKSSRKLAPSIAATGLAPLRDRVKHPHCDKPGDDGGECGPDHKQHPARALPDFAKSRGLDKHVHQVGRAADNVGCHSEQKQS